MSPSKEKFGKCHTSCVNDTLYSLKSLFNIVIKKSNWMKTKLVAIIPFCIPDIVIKQKKNQNNDEHSNHF